LRISDCGLKIRNRKSEIRNPQSAIRNKKGWLPASF